MTPSIVQIYLAVGDDGENRVVPMVMSIYSGCASLVFKKIHGARKVAQKVARP
jgi:hypothetical protein